MSAVSDAAVVARWRVTLKALITKEKFVEREVAYWETKVSHAKHTTDRAHDQAMVRLRQKELAATRSSAGAARRVISRHTKARHISETGVALIKRLEGFSATRYDDGVGVQTIGFGTTSSDVGPLPAHVTRTEADHILRKALAEVYEPSVRAAAKKYGLKLNQHEFDALVSFVYNLGAGALSGGPGFETIGRALKSKSKAAIGNAMLIYDDPNVPAVHAGLHARRVEERELFLS